MHAARWRGSTLLRCAKPGDLLTYARADADAQRAKRPSACPASLAPARRRSTACHRRGYSPPARVAVPPSFPISAHTYPSALPASLPSAPTLSYALPHSPPLIIPRSHDDDADDASALTPRAVASALVQRFPPRPRSALGYRFTVQAVAAKPPELCTYLEGTYKKKGRRSLSLRPDSKEAAHGSGRTLEDRSAARAAASRSVHTTARCSDSEQAALAPRSIHPCVRIRVSQSRLSLSRSADHTIWTCSVGGAHQRHRHLPTLVSLVSRSLLLILSHLPAPPAFEPPPPARSVRVPSFPILPYTVIVISAVPTAPAVSPPGREKSYICSHGPQTRCTTYTQWYRTCAAAAQRSQWELHTYYIYTSRSLFCAHAPRG